MKNTGNYQHGYSKTPTHRTWLSMKRRCDNPNACNYYLYGGRGIKYESRWAKFENFLEDMGERPVGKMSLERIDHNGNYCKENCKWIPLFDQGSNKRNNRLIEYNGETKTLAQWARHSGVSVSTLFSRLNIQGWDMEKAITIKPVKGRNQYGTSKLYKVK
jgi:hypothetical protein